MANRETPSVHLREGKEKTRKLLPKTNTLKTKNPQDVIKKQTKIRTETRALARETLEYNPEKRVSFAEAVKLLEGKLDLEAARRNAVKSHSRWRIVKTLIKNGVIKDISEYETLFDKVTINEADLRKVLESLKRGKKILPIFDPGLMTPDELFEVLFKKARIPHYTNFFSVKILAQLRRINPKHIPNLADLDGKFYDKQEAAFKYAYEKAFTLKATDAQICFTLDLLDTTHTSTSATEDIQAFAKGKMKFLSPTADFLRYRYQIDSGLRKIASRSVNFDGLTDESYQVLLDDAFADNSIDKYLPDQKIITRYPNYVFENGSIPTLDFDTNKHMVRLFGCNPKLAYDKLGSRISLG